jgi:putative sigma-54 modulation protein
MQLIITARHFDITEGIKDHIRDKVDKFERYLKKIIEIHVILSIEHERQIAEIILKSSDVRLMAKDESGNMYSSIDSVAHKIEHQLRDHKDRMKHHKRKPLKKEESFAEQEEQIPLIIEDKRNLEKPMSPEEAMLELDVQGLEFLVFKDSNDSQKKVIYRRRDNNYGLIIAD